MNNKENLELKKEIKELESQKRKIEVLKALKNSAKIGHLIAPYAVSAGITFGIFSSLGMMPFTKNEHKKYLETMKEFDSYGNIRYEEQYDHFENVKNTIIFYDNWKLVNGMYTRNIEIYDASKIDFLDIEEVVNNNNVKNVLGNPTSTKIEIKNNVDEDELKKGSYLKAQVYNQFLDNYITVEETFKESLNNTLNWLFINIAASILITLSSISNRIEKYQEETKEIEAFCPTNDLETKILTKKKCLNIKKRG